MSPCIRQAALSAGLSALGSSGESRFPLPEAVSALKGLKPNQSLLGAKNAGLCSNEECVCLYTHENQRSVGRRNPRFRHPRLVGH